MLPQTREARTDAVVAAAVELATIAPAQRSSIWRAMHGVDNPYLIEPLLDSLAYDSNDYVRRAAAATLDAFLAEPRVLAALERAQASDASEAVRESAQRALLIERERNELALQALLDETLPARQRLRAIWIHSGRSVRSVPLTDEAARTVFEIGSGSTDPEVRRTAWSTLGGGRVYNPTFRSVLLDDFANHSSDSVRSAAALALAQYAHDPEVRAALEQAESDASFEIRRAARMALGKIPR